MTRTLSPLQLFFCGLFLFCSHVFAASAVLGIDLGTEYIKAALVKPGIPLEIVLTKDSRRKETSAVAFKPPQGGPKPGSYPERAYGSDAMALAARFPGDVYPNLKTLLGLPVENNAVVKEYAARHPALKLEEHPTRKTAAFKSSGAFTADEEAWLVEELLAMELQSVRRNAEALAGADTSVRSVVITVPPFYTTDEKRAVELAADLAGLRVLSLVSDGLAVGLNYATSRQFPNINDGGRPEVHMVFDMGAGSTKATILKFQSRTVKDVGKFNKTVQEVQVLGSGWDQTLGGDTLNGLIIDDMVAQFVGSNGAKAASVTTEKVQTHGRTVAKLSKEAERVRHVLSANINTAASFEGLFEDVDFRYKISRADFEAMAGPHAERVTAVVQHALDVAGLRVSDLDSVILHGGATRTPFVQKQLEQIFGSSDKLRSNVNSDEAAVFGVGFRAAELSPSFRVKEIRVAEGASYAAGMKWTNSKNQKTQNQQLWTATSHLGAAPKDVTFQNKDDFVVDFYQLVPAADGSGRDVEVPTKLLTFKNLTATVALLGEKYACEPSAVQFKVGLRLNGENGEVDVTKATVECETDEPEKESIIDGVKNLFGFGKNKDQQPLDDGDKDSEDETRSSSSTSSKPMSSSTESSSRSSSVAASASTAAADEKTEGGAKKKVTITIPVKYELEKTGITQLSKSDIQKLKDRLKAFEASDRARLQREETFNQLEGYTYKVRSLLENDDFVAVSTEKERDAIKTISSETSEWLYGEGADATRDELKKKHGALRELVDPIEARISEAEKRPELLKGLKEALAQSLDFTKSIRERIVEYDNFHSSRSAATAASAAASPSPSSSAAPSEDDEFAGLEDDDTAAAAAATGAASEDPLKDLGPVPPMYTIEDLKEYEDLHASVTAWLAEKEAAQAKLGPTDNPVLTAKDLQAKRDQLDKVGMDLAMKAVRNYENAQKKSKSKPSSKSKSKKATSKSATTSKTASSATSGTSSTASSSTVIPKQEDAKKDDRIKHEEL